MAGEKHNTALELMEEGRASSGGKMITQKTNILRIKRQYDYAGHEELRVNIDTLQQWNTEISIGSTDVEIDTGGFWSDIKIVTTNNDDDLGEI